MAKAAVGSIVHVDTGNGTEWGIVVKHGDDKDTIVPLGKGTPVGYREPEDRDNEGSGDTWWNAT